MAYPSLMPTNAPRAVIFLLFVFLGEMPPTHGWLNSEHFYSRTCPNALEIIHDIVVKEVRKEQRMGASLLRLHFHDCFVHGCDASVLLNDTSNSELTAGPNKNSARGMEVIEEIKSNLESQCRGVVSCADILAVAARDSIVALGGPHYFVKLGRADSKLSYSEETVDIPPPTSNFRNLSAAFAKKNMDDKDLVILSGAHTIGSGKCTNFRGHIYNDTDIDVHHANSLKQICSKNKGDDNNLAPLDQTTPAAFDTNYYKNVVNRRGLLHSDQELFNGNSGNVQLSRHRVIYYSQNPIAFFADFAAAMTKMGDISPPPNSPTMKRTLCYKSS